MPFEMLCVIGTNSLIPGFASIDYFIIHGWWHFHLNNPSPHENGMTNKLLPESKGM